MWLAVLSSGLAVLGCDRGTLKKSFGVSMNVCGAAETPNEQDGK